MVGPGNDKASVPRRAALRVAGLTALAAGVGSAATGPTAAAQQASVSGIVGTWRMRLPPGVVRTNDIDFMAVFIPGGVFLGLDSPIAPAIDPGSTSDQLDHAGPWGGQWLQLPDGRVRATSLQLNYDRQAIVVSEEWISYTLAYNGATDTIAGTYEWRASARDGTLLHSNSGQIQGTRVRVET
jgi:hypothetical protein